MPVRGQETRAQHERPDHDRITNQRPNGSGGGDRGDDRRPSTGSKSRAVRPI
jgi:hypothetical protein